MVSAARRGGYETRRLLSAMRERREAVVTEGIAAFTIFINGGIRAEIYYYPPLHTEKTPDEIQRRAVSDTPIPRLKSDRSQSIYGTSYWRATNIIRPPHPPVRLLAVCANRRAYVMRFGPPGVLARRPETISHPYRTIGRLVGTLG